VINPSYHVEQDKTGTLTTGLFRVQSKIVFPREDADDDDNEDEHDPIRLACALESKSAHPLASAIIAEHVGCVVEFEASGHNLPDVRKVKVIEGQGISGWVETEPDEWVYVIVGNERCLRSNGGKTRMPRGETKNSFDAFMASQSQGMQVLLVSIEDELRCCISLSDNIRPEARHFVESLSALGIHDVTMLTGDASHVALDVCR
jgi:Cd2+/Zn2+-exporting ATPase